MTEQPRRAGALPGCGPALPPPGGHGSPPHRQSIYERVRGAGQASRAEIAKALGVSPGTVTAGAAELIEAGYLREAVVPARAAGRGLARGRPPAPLEIVPRARLVAGVKLGDAARAAVVLDMAGTVLGEAARPATGPGEGLEHVAADVAAVVAAAAERAGVEVAALSGVGVGLPGMIDHEAGRAAWSPVLEGTGLPLAEAIAGATGLTTHVDNDANTLTLAELWFGAGRHLPGFAVVTIENGVGMGLVIGNRLFRGGLGMGMELGHTKVQLDGALCRCGRRGCLEAYVADYALIREAATALGRAPAPDLLDVLHAEAKAGHPAAAGIFRRAGRYMALGLSNVAHLFDPARIILSGERMRFDLLYAREVLGEMEAATLRGGRAPTPVEIHAWGSSIWARGAGALALGHAVDAALGGERIVPA